MSKPTPRILLGLSQRVDLVSDYGERRDGIDQAWAQLVSELAVGAVPVGLLNSAPDPRDYIEAMALDAVILTGGNDPSAVINASNVAPERDSLEQACLSYCEAHAKPVLGVCRGFQMMNLFLGGTLSKIDGHVRTTHPLAAANVGSSTQMRDMHVNSYHTLAIRDEDLAHSLTPIYRCTDGTVEAASHSSLPWLGVMWHPERPGPSDSSQKSLIARFFADALAR